MRYLILSLSSSLFLSLAACASSPQEPGSRPAAAAKSNALPPQNLAPGECGYFAWTVEAAPQLFLFLSERQSLMASADGPVALTPQNSEFPAQSYSRSDGSDIMVEFGAGEETAQGTRYPQTRLRTKTDEGWDKLIPLAAVRSCQR